MSKIAALFLSYSMVAVLTGCAAGRGDIQLPSVAYSGSGSEGKGKTITIASVEDKRIF